MIQQILPEWVDSLNFITYYTYVSLTIPTIPRFNKGGHDITDMIPIPIEKVYPENDDLLRRRREKLWIQRYDAVSFEGGNTRE